MTPTQRKHLRKGARRITEAANNGATENATDCYTTVGTYATERKITECLKEALQVKGFKKIEIMQWIKINGDKSLPKHRCNIVYIMAINRNQVAIEFDNNDDFMVRYLKNHCTHYYIIENKELPKNLNTNEN